MPEMTPHEWAMWNHPTQCRLRKLKGLSNDPPGSPPENMKIEIADKDWDAEPLPETKSLSSEAPIMPATKNPVEGRGNIEYTDQENGVRYYYDEDGVFVAEIF